MSQIINWVFKGAKIIVIIYLLLFVLAIPSNFVNMPGHKVYTIFVEHIIIPIILPLSILMIPAFIIIVSVTLKNKFFPQQKIETSVVNAQNSNTSLDKMLRIVTILAAVALLPIILVVIFMMIGG